MSRYYNMQVLIYPDSPGLQEGAKERLEEEWAFEDVAFSDGFVEAYGDGALCGGETGEEFAERISKVAWELNGGYCEVVVTATYLENLPCDEYKLSREKYEQLMGDDTNEE